MLNSSWHFEDVLYILRSMNYSKRSSISCSREQSVSSQPPNFTFLLKRKRARIVGILWWRFVSPPIKPTLENRPLSPVHDCLLNTIFGHLQYDGARWLERWRFRLIFERCLVIILPQATKILMKLSLFSRTPGWWHTIGCDGFLPDPYKVTEYDYLFTSSVTK